jgi:hypothetical protein
MLMLAIYVYNTTGSCHSVVRNSQRLQTAEIGITKILIQDGRCSSRGSKRTHPEFESRILPLFLPAQWFTF